MMLKTITHPETGERFKLGRKRPAPGRRKLQLHRYLNLSTLPAPPASVHYSREAEIALSQLYGNDSLSDCVICAMAHLIGVFNGNAGQTPTIFTQAQIDAFYGAVGGYVIGNSSTDQGCDENTALQYWEKTGLAGHKILGAVTLTPETARHGIWLLEGAMSGSEMPDAWVGADLPSKSGWFWNVAGDPDPNNGHAMAHPGYNSNGMDDSTWGMVGGVSWAAVEKYMVPSANGELHAVLTPEILDRASQKAPSGFDLDQLIADLDAMGGNVQITSS